jgi:deoxyribonuclease-4
VSIAGGVALAPARGKAVGAESIQIFSRSPRMLRNTKPLAPEEVAAFRDNLSRHGVRAVVIHANYLINLGSPKKSALKVSRQAVVEELERAQALGVRDVILHPGAHMGKGEARAIRTISEGLDACLAAADAPGVFLTLENTAGQGTVVGYSFEQLAEMVKGSSHPDRIGVCIDTCHTFAAGYDLRTREAYDGLMRKVDATVGLARVHAFHLNDSKAPLGSRVDRHEDIGKGHLGKEAFRFLVNDDRFKDLPGCLEYPGTDGGYRKNLKVLRSMITGTSTTRAARPRRT